MAKSGSAFTGGKLSLKGEKKKKSKKKSSKSKHSVGEDSPYANDAKKTSSMDEKQLNHSSSDEDEELTAAEKRSKSFKQKRERKEMEKIVSMSHRERVETFNAKLGELTEHNDIPRVSAAGNG
jgi:protein FAM32A